MSSYRAVSADLASRPAAETAKPFMNLRSEATAERYLGGMQRQGELLPNAAGLVLAAPGNLVRQAGYGVPALDRWIGTTEFLASPQGQRFLNHQYVPTPNEPEYKAVLRRLGLPEINQTELYNTYAAELAARTGSMLISAVWTILDNEQYRTYLGYELVGVVSRPTPVESNPNGSLRPIGYTGKPNAF